MIKKLSRIHLLALSLVFLTGCATQEHNVKLHESFWQNPKHKITVAKTGLADKPMLHKNGGQGLLDMAISGAANSKFNCHLEKTNLTWYNDLPQKFAAQFKQRNIFAQIHPVDIELKQKKKSSFTVQTNGDKVLFIELQRLGAIRNYYGFIPTGAPDAYCVLKGELIDQKDKKVLWRDIIEIKKSVKGEWDQPPSYPNFTYALEKAIASAQEEIIDDFFSGH